MKPFSPNVAEEVVADAPLVSRVRVEQAEPGAMIGESCPRLSWVVDSSDPSYLQAQFTVELSTASGVSTRTVESGESVLVDWPFDPLVSRQAAAVRVRCAAHDGSLTRWSDLTFFEVGLLESSDWVADFVSPRGLGGLDDGAPVLFTQFELEELPVRARLYATAHGIYEAQLNGRRIGADVFAPGWTAYEKRLRYQCYDVTDSLVSGSNTIAALLGNGWYRGQLVWNGNRASYGDRLALLAQLELTFADGTSRVVATDSGWRGSASRILFDDFYDGERRDLRLHDPGDPLSLDPASSAPVDVVDGDRARLVARR